MPYSAAIAARAAGVWMVRYRASELVTTNACGSPRRRNATAPTPASLAVHAKVGAGIVRAGDELHRWPEQVHIGIRGSGHDATENLGAVLVKWHSCVPSVREAELP